MFYIGMINVIMCCITVLYFAVTHCFIIDIPLSLLSSILRGGGQTRSNTLFVNIHQIFSTNLVHVFFLQPSHVKLCSQFSRVSAIMQIFLNFTAVILCVRVKTKSMHQISGKWPKDPIFQVSDHSDVCKCPHQNFSLGKCEKWKTGSALSYFQLSLSMHWENICLIIRGFYTQLRNKLYILYWVSII